MNNASINPEVEPEVEKMHAEKARANYELRKLELEVARQRTLVAEIEVKLAAYGQSMSW